MSRSLRSSILALVIFMVACGGGERQVDAELAAVHSGPAGVTVVGSSIVWHPVALDIDWTGSWGMAATRRELDFAHQVSIARATSVATHNTYDIWSLEATRRARLSLVRENVGPATIAIVAPFDGIYWTSESMMAPPLEALFDAVAGAAQLVCVSTYWADGRKDALLRRACEARGGRYVDIGDLRANRQDEMGQFGNPGVDDHPHDWSHALIAQRILAVIKP